MRDRAEREALANNFFQAPNLIEWDDYQNDRLPAATAKRVQPWIDRLLRGAEPLILPFAQTDGTTWYAAADTSRAFRHLQEELKSFVGSTYSDFEGQPTHLDLAVPRERALAARYGRHVIRLCVRPEHREIVGRRLTLLVQRRDEAPARGDSVPRPAGRILADFDEALRLWDGREAAHCIEELERNGQLDAQNLLYLRIRADEARGEWQAVVDAAQRYGLLHASRRPRRVGQAILRAIYAIEWAAFEVGQDATGALARFAEIGSRVEPLLVARRLYDCPEADALFVMSAVARTRDRVAAAAMLDNVNSGAPHLPWLKRLVATLPQGTPASETARPVVVDPLVEAREAHFEGDLDRAWSLIGRLEPGEAATQLMIRCAWDLGTLETAKLALGAFERLNPETHERVQTRHSIATALQQLRDLVAPAPAEEPMAARSHVPQSWLEWAEALLADQCWTDAAEVARRGSDEWDPHDLASPEHATKLAEILSRLDDIGWARISDCLPYLLSSLARCSSLPRPMSRVLEQLTSIHLMDAAPGRLFFSTLASLCDFTLQIGVGEHAYASLLRDCLSAVEGNASAEDFDSLLEFLDVLVTHAAPETALRSALAGAIAGIFVRFKRRADPFQLVLLSQMLTEASCEVPASLSSPGNEPRTQQAMAALSGRAIALYSLKESVLHRVTLVLESTVPESRITTFHDKAGGSKALRAAARNADIFVIATAAAAHAATGFIEAERPVGATILRPAGQGSASMLRALREFADTEL